MNKRLLIISPYFPPVNAADMQRVRMSLPYFNQFGWDAEIVTIDPKYAEIAKDDLLLQSIPAGIKIHIVQPVSKKWTYKLGLGSIAIRSLRSYREKVDKLLRSKHFDLIYFSTTQFAVCILGAHWKKKFNVPYVIDMQDPWHSEYYRHKPKNERPPKYWFSYRMNRYLEPKAMRQADGLISVSEHYIEDLKTRYPVIKNVPAETITFGAFEPDFEIAEKNKSAFKPLLDPAFTNIVYMGRGGADMHKSVSVLLKALKCSVDKEPGVFNKIKVYFIGTSYAPVGQGNPTILPLAKQFSVEDHVVEITGRISYYHTLLTLQQANALFIPGSDDPRYTASKIYPYVLTNKPLLAIFNPNSPAIEVLKEYNAKYVLDYDMPDATEKTGAFLRELMNNSLGDQKYNEAAITKYSAENMVKLQCELFDKVLNANK